MKLIIVCSSSCNADEDPDLATANLGSINEINGGIASVADGKYP